MNLILINFLLIQLYKPVQFLLKWESATQNNNNGKPITGKLEKNVGIVRKEEMLPSFMKKTVSMKIVLHQKSKIPSGRTYLNLSVMWLSSQDLSSLVVHISHRDLWSRWGKTN